jgi:hypothetical protein
VSREAEFTRLITLMRHLNDHSPEMATQQFQTDPAYVEGMVATLRRNRLSAYCYQLLEANSLQALLPDTLLTEMTEAADEQSKRAAEQLRLLAKLKERFDAADIPFIALKGLYISQRFFGNISRRFMWDLDVLIAPRHLPRATSVLQEMGMTNDSLQPVDVTNSWWGIHAVEFTSDRGKVDIHVNLRNLPGIEIDLDHQWRERRNYAIDGIEIPCAGDENTLFLCCLGLGTDLRRGRRNLRKIWDVYIMLREMDGQTDWHDFLQRRQQDGSLKLVINVLAFVIYLVDCMDECLASLAAMEHHSRLLLITNKNQAVALYEHDQSVWRNHLLFSRMLPIPAVQYWGQLFVTAPARQLFYRGMGPKHKG